MKEEMDLQKEMENNFFRYKILTYPEIISKLLNDRDVNPINLEINLTNICNHSCIWCTYDYLHKSTESLNFENVVNLLRDARKMGVESITWTGGGEPTIHPKFTELISIAAELGFKQGLNTNGYCLTETMMDIIVDNFSYIRFSIDAATSEVHSLCHKVVKQQFEKIIDNIKKIVDKKEKTKSILTIGYSFLIDSYNLNDVIKSIKLAKSLGVNYLQFKPIVYYHKSNEQFSNESEVSNVLVELLKVMEKEETDSFKIRYIEHKFNNIQLCEENYGRFYDKCYGCKLLASVAANGSVDICCAYKGVKKWSIGNIYINNLKEIWMSNNRKIVESKIDVLKCPPMCKADEINKVIYFLKNFKAQREFI